MKNFLFVFLIGFAISVTAQKQADVSLELLDGNIIKGTSMVNDVELITSYGKLIIPVAKISHIDVGIRKDNGVSEKAKSYLKILSTSNSDETRKATYNDLIKLGIKAIPVINEFYNDPKNISEEFAYTGEYTIDNALSEIKTANNLSHEAPMEDILTLDNNYTIGGNYNFSKMDIKTDYGNLSVPKEKIKSIDVSVVSEGGKGEFSFKLLASKNISGNTNGGWLKTGITVKSGQRFTITANGEVTLSSLSNSKYKPDGSSKAEGAAEFTKPYGASDDGEYSSGGYPTYGQVVYKIGESSTETLKAGAKFSGTAKTSGVIMIAIYETVYNASNKGAYNVKVALGK